MNARLQWNMYFGQSHVTFGQIMSQMKGILSLMKDDKLS